MTTIANRTNIIARKGSNTMSAWACNHSTALAVARGYTDRGHDVTLVNYPELSVETHESKLGLNS